MFNREGSTMTSNLPVRLLAGTAAAALAGTIALSPAPARAWGVIVGVPPIVVAPPVVPYPYYPPYYAGPGYYYGPGYAYPAPAAAPAQPQASTQGQSTQAPQYSQANTPYGRTCYAGVYTCAALPYTHVGTGCSCPGIGAPSYGVVQ